MDEARLRAWWSFRPESDALLAAVGETEQFVRDQLSDARSFSLDRPKSRVPRIETLKKWSSRFGG